MQTEIVITTEGIGSDNTLFFTYNIHSPQGMARVRYWAEYLSNRQQAPVNVYTRYNWREGKTPFYRLGN